MAVTPVSLDPSLRAWYLAGVTHILCDGPVNAAFADVGSDSPLDREILSPPAASLPASVKAGGRFYPSFKKREEEGEPLGTLAAGTSLASGRSGGEDARQNGLLALPGSDCVPADPKDWPFPWGDRFSKSIRAPILWTYHELGEDLLGAGGSERSAFFKSFISDLRLPKGSSVFWPSAMPVPSPNASSRMEANPALYAAGVRHLNPQVMVVFGDQAVADMGLAGHIKKFRQEMVEGRLLLLLPNIEELLRQPEQRRSAVSLLRAILASINFS